MALVTAAAMTTMTVNVYADSAAPDAFALYDNGHSLEGLSSVEALLYNSLKAKLIAMANGSGKIKTKNTSEGKKKYISTQVIITEKEVNGIWNLNGKNIRTVIKRLIDTCPYALYWFNTTEGYSGSLYGDTITISFIVGSDYAVTDGNSYYKYCLDLNAVKRAKKAVSNARAIVAVNAGKSDYEKMQAYLFAIENANTYNSDAALYINNTVKIDPWSFVSILDNAPATNGVCEAYAKAFNLLCDLSDFSSPQVKSYIVSGNTPGAHMWNIVTMGDGKNYLVDVTNCDDASVGAPNRLFPGPDGVVPVGSVAGGYTFYIDEANDASYAYDADTKALYGTGADSVLNLSTTRYDPSTSGVFTGKTTLEDKKEEATSDKNSETRASETENKEAVKEEVKDNSKEASENEVKAKKSKTVKKSEKNKVTLKKNSLSLKKGKTYTIVFSKETDKSIIKKITYSSSDKKIADVAKAGRIKAVKKGTAIISVKVKFIDNTTKTLKVNVRVTK